MTKNRSFLQEEDQKMLKSLGLSETETAIYLATLELGEGHIQEISRKSGVKRTSIYHLLEDLKSQGLLTEVTKGKRRLFSAASPYQLVELQKSKVSSVEQLIPQLLAMQNNAKHKPKVSYYDGIEGIKAIYRMALRDKQTIYAWEDLDRTKDILPGTFFKSYPVERAEKKIPARCIDRDTPFARQFTSENNVRLARESRFIDSEEFGTEINVFGSKVAFFGFDKKNPFGVVIEDPGIAAAVRVAWQELWDRLPSASTA